MTIFISKNARKRGKVWILGGVLVKRKWKIGPFSGVDKKMQVSVFSPTQVMVFSASLKYSIQYCQSNQP